MRSGSHFKRVYNLPYRFGLVLVCFLAFEGALFNTAVYPSILEPDSTTGSVEQLLRDEARRVKPNRNQVLAVGHSRMALLPRFANEVGTGYTFASIALGGTTPRVWFYMLRSVDPKARRYAAVLIPTDDYDEPDVYDYLAEREADIHYVIAQLGLQDLFEFPSSYQSRRLQWLAFRSILLKGSIYNRDLLEFLTHPVERVEKVRLYNRDSFSWRYTFTPDQASLAGINIDWQARTVAFPKEIPANTQKRIYDELFPAIPPDRGRQTAYFQYWYGRIVDHFRGSGTKIFFLRVPRAPLPPPPHPPKRNSAVRQMAANRDVVVLAEDLFDSLERPEFFVDAWHLNRAGIERFSRILAAAVREHLGSPKTHNWNAF